MRGRARTGRSENKVCEKPVWCWARPTPPSLLHPPTATVPGHRGTRRVPYPVPLGVSPTRQRRSCIPGENEHD